MRERCLWVLHGVGRNGKSTYVETPQQLLGDYAMNTPTSTLLQKQGHGGVPNDVARLKGARFVSVSETGEGRLLDEALVKSITGEEGITARELYEKASTWLPEFKIFLATNHQPVVKGNDNGFWDRVRQIPFEIRIKDAEIDNEIHAKLRAEAPGILAWAVEGCRAWMTTGMRTPPEVIVATAEYRADMDLLGDFLLERTELGVGLTVAPRALYAAYRGWAEATGLKPITEISLGRKLKERQVAQSRTAAGRYWDGIELRVPTETSPFRRTTGPVYSSSHSPTGLPWAPEEDTE